VSTPLIELAMRRGSLALCRSNEVSSFAAPGFAAVLLFDHAQVVTSYWLTFDALNAQRRCLFSESGASNS
jgi:hypothetical protein